MTDKSIIDMLYIAFATTLKLGAPLLILSLVVGLIVSIFQAATQIHEQTLTFVPKLLIIGIALIILAPWMMTVMKEYVYNHFISILEFI